VYTLGGNLIDIKLPEFRTPFLHKVGECVCIHREGSSCMILYQTGWNGSAFPEVDLFPTKSLGRAIL